MPALIGFLQNYLWPTIWTTLLIGTPLLFYLGLLTGKQAGYVSRSLMHPIRFLIHRQALCPQCLGSAHGGGGEMGLLMCDFCLREQTEQLTADRVLAGYIRRARLLKDWQWRSWSRKSPFFFPTTHDLR